MRIRPLALLFGSLLAWAGEAGAQNPVVHWVTSGGEFDVELCMETSAVCAGAAPTTVDNFLGYVDRGDYTVSVFHRSVPGSIIQGGAFRRRADPPAIVSIPTASAIQPEFNQSNVRGTLAMAKNGLGEATSQWFFNIANNTGLDAQDFTVFGIVLGDGMEVVDLLGSLQTCDIRATLGGVWGQTPLNGYPSASCNPPQSPGTPPPYPPVSPAVQFNNLIYATVTRAPEPGALLTGGVAGILLAAMGSWRKR